MYVVYHERYGEVYTSDPAAASGRIECIKKELEGHFGFVETTSASEADLQLVHSQSHLDWVKQHGLTYEIALLAVGGALKASELAMQGEPAFGLIRPPGHHAGPSSSWGFCYFNNVAIAVEKLRKEGVVPMIQTSQEVRETLNHPINNISRELSLLDSHNNALDSILSLQDLGLIHRVERNLIYLTILALVVSVLLILLEIDIIGLLTR